MFENLLNEAFSYMVSLGVEKITEIEKQYNNQNLLLLTICQFTESVFFKNEYKNVEYMKNEDAILSIVPESISPILGLDEIVDNISPVLETVFICFDCVEQERLFNIIVSQYLAKRNLTVTLLELSKQQRQDTEYISNKIDALKSDITIVSESVSNQETMKRRMIDSGLGSKINSFILKAAKGYIHIATKKMPQYKGDATDKNIISQYMDMIEKLIDSDFPDIDDEFYKKPMPLLRTDISGFKNVELDVYEVLSIYKSELSQVQDDLLKYSNYISNDFLLIMTKLMGVIDNDVNFVMHSLGIGQLIKYSKPANGFDMARTTKDEYKQLGNFILALKPYIF